MNAALSYMSGARVSEHMLVAAVRHPTSVTVGELRRYFLDLHVHAALLVTDDGRLDAVVERADLDGGLTGDAPVEGCDDDPAAPRGRLVGRIVAPDAAIEDVYRGMRASGRRRLAVVDSENRLLGLLCLKRSGRGFCTAVDVASRVAGGD